VSGRLEVLLGGEGWLWRRQVLLEYLDLEVEQGRMGMIRKECASIIPPAEQGRGRVYMGKRNSRQFP
jgi:hypothetical protein